ncbi:class I SAM-dependent methyltransferase [Tardiphaga sp. 866_E4_N2_1]|uniref:class I SAM-dependent methyltransferase n=1 Tax=unclassified Tardiphaga TaxID=2631404 RepID=UPI003F287781
MSNGFRPLSTKQTQDFYEGLSSGKEARGIWGKESRFNPETIAQLPSVRRHFQEKIATVLSPSHSCLDLGCGPGGFLTVAAPLCSKIVGVDIVPAFVEECRAQIDRRGLENASVILNESTLLPFGDGEFDRVLMVDTIHHLENASASMNEVHRVLKDDGQLVVFEPNKLNPLLAAMCALDRNEHGLLRLGTFASYRKLLRGKFAMEVEEYNGLLIGPTGKLSTAISDFLVRPAVAPIAGWLSPKIFFTARKV